MQRELLHRDRLLALVLFQEYDGHISGKFLLAKSLNYHTASLLQGTFGGRQGASTIR